MIQCRWWYIHMYILMYIRIQIRTTNMECEFRIPISRVEYTFSCRLFEVVRVCDIRCFRYILLYIPEKKIRKNKKKKRQTPLPTTLAIRFIRFASSSSLCLLFFLFFRFVSSLNFFLPNLHHWNETDERAEFDWILNFSPSRFLKLFIFHFFSQSYMFWGTGIRCWLMFGHAQRMHTHTHTQLSHSVQMLINSTTKRWKALWSRRWNDSKQLRSPSSVCANCWPSRKNTTVVSINLCVRWRKIFSVNTLLN